MAAVAVARLASIDGEIRPVEEVTISVTDDGLLRGDGAFEVFRLYDGHSFALDEHLARLDRSCRSLRLAYPEAMLVDEIGALVQKAAGVTCDLRIVLTRGGRRLLLLEPPVDVGSTLRLGFVAHSPTDLLAGVKSLSYAPNMLATRLARERGFDEALFITSDGRILEAPTATFFWVAADGILRTPPLSERILASVTRAAVLGGLDVEETVCRIEDALSCREAFLASTVREVQGIDAIEDSELKAPGPVTRAVAEAFQARVRRLVQRAGGAVGA
jgi:branched-chain amino acid aminotransferase